MRKVPPIRGRTGHTHLCVKMFLRGAFLRSKGAFCNYLLPYSNRNIVMVEIVKFIPVYSEILL